MIAIQRRWISGMAALLLLVMAACQPASRMPITPVGASTSATASLQPPFAAIDQTPSPTVTAFPGNINTSTVVPPTPAATSTFMPSVTETVEPPVVFAVIGDYGTGDRAEAAVAQLILSWNPEFIITLGDNNYPIGSADHIDQAIGQFFHSFIYPYNGSYGAGADVNRFFPTLGNHDFQTDNGQPYYDYFALPGNERYYDLSWGPVHLFALDNVTNEPDGVGASSVQAEWLKAGLAQSTSAWNIVYMHYPPYSSGAHGSTDWAVWPYQDWGANAVLAGHDHTYERLEENGLTYFVNGLGGDGRYDFINIVEGSKVRYNADLGAMRVEATSKHILFEFINRSGEVVDSYEMVK